MRLPLPLAACLAALGVAAAGAADLAPLPPATPLTVDGQATFTHDGNGKKPLPVAFKLPDPKAAYYLTAEALLPGPGASVAVSLEAAPAAKADAAPPAVRVIVDKDGKTVRSGGRADPTWELADPAAAVPVRVLILPGAADVSVGASHATGSPAGVAAVTATLAGKATLRNVRLQPVPAAGYVPLARWAEQGNAAVAGPDAAVGKFAAGALPAGWVTSAGVPFFLSNAARPALDVAAAATGLKEPQRHKVLFTPAAGRPNRVATTAPGDQYAALHLLAFSAGRPGHAPRTTVRVGYYGGASNILEDSVVNVPGLAGGDAEHVVGRVPVKRADGTAGTVYHLRVPLPQTGNVKEFKRFDLELTRDMNDHTVPPDPNEFGQIPAGLPSDVVVLAAALEPSPVTMDYTTDAPGNVWHDTQKAVFKATYSNRSGKPQVVTAAAFVQGPGTGEEVGITPKKWAVATKLELKPGESKTADIDVTPEKRGWYSVTLAASVDGRQVQRRDTTFAVLAPDTRQALADSPFGVWEFWRPHSVAFRPDQIEKLAVLMNKGGWRWTYGGSPLSGQKGEDADAELKRLRDKYKITHNLSGLPNSYQRGTGWFNEAEMKATFPAAVAHVIKVSDGSIKVMHESRSSLDLLRRYSEFLGGKPYDMPAEEKAKLDQQFENVKNYCLAVKKINPNAKIVLINDYPVVAFEFLKRKMPPEAFDAIGLEGAMFLRQPERQPDWLTVLGHHHDMRRALKHYGYDKPVWTTEARYHPTAPGALSLHEQAVISVREAMIDLNLGIERMAAAGILKDPSDDYHWSNWGSAGFCFRDPEINPKPSYAMYAWLTQVLDRARPAGHVATPNTSLHVVAFKKPDGSRVYGLWCVTGRQEVTLNTAGAGTLYDAFGNPTVHTGGKVTLTVSPTPLYLTGTTIEAVTAAVPVEQKDANPGAPLVEFDRPDQFKVVAGASPVLEGNWDTPRLKGQFDVSFGTEDGASAVRVALKPDADPRKLLPRYVELALAEPIKLAGRPHEFTARVKGNAGWGRVMFEVTDAKGRVFTSCGNQYAGASNGQDPHGQSFVSFAGWQTVRFPLVGMYPGSDQAVGWSRNYNWWPTNTPEERAIPELVAKAQGDYEKALAAYEAAVEAAKKAGGKPPASLKKPLPPRGVGRNLGITPVDYPLTLTKVIVDMRPSILYLDAEVPVADPVIHIDRLGVTQAPDR